MITCKECDAQFAQESSSGNTCFRCKCVGLRVNFVGGGGYGREAFHNGTNHEARQEIEAGARAAGDEIRRLPERAELV